MSSDGRYMYHHQQQPGISTNYDYSSYQHPPPASYENTPQPVQQQPSFRSMRPPSAASQPPHSPPQPAHYPHPQHPQHPPPSYPTSYAPTPHHYIPQQAAPPPPPPPQAAPQPTQWSEQQHQQHWAHYNQYPPPAPPPAQTAHVEQQQQQQPPPFSSGPGRPETIPPPVTSNNDHRGYAPPPPSTPDSRRVEERQPVSHPPPPAHVPSQQPAPIQPPPQQQKPRRQELESPPAPPPSLPPVIQSGLDFRKLLDSYRIIMDGAETLKTPGALNSGHGRPAPAAEALERMLQSATYGVHMLEAVTTPQPQPQSQAQSTSTPSSDTRPSPKDKEPEDVKEPLGNASTSGPPPSKRQKTEGDGAAEGQVCLGCNATSTPEWRRGPMGPRTLCNACGLVYAKMIKKRFKDKSIGGSKKGNGQPISNQGHGDESADPASEEDDDDYRSQGHRSEFGDHPGRRD